MERGYRIARRSLRSTNNNDCSQDVEHRYLERTPRCNEIGKGEQDLPRARPEGRRSSCEDFPHHIQYIPARPIEVYPRRSAVQGYSARHNISRRSMGIERIQESGTGGPCRNFRSEANPCGEECSHSRIYRERRNTCSSP